MYKICVLAINRHVLAVSMPYLALQRLIDLENDRVSFGKKLVTLMSSRPAPLFFFHLLCLVQMSYFDHREIHVINIDFV